MLRLFPGMNAVESISQLYCVFLASLDTVSRISGNSGAASAGSRLISVFSTMMQWPERREVDGGYSTGC